MSFNLKTQLLAPIMALANRPLSRTATSVIFASIPLIVAHLANIMSYKDFIQYSASKVITPGSSEEKYDFIVVGGGSAGAAVAGRLSEKFKVVLLEAGGDPNPLTYIPAMSGYLLNLPQIDWQHETVRLNNSGFALLDEKSRWPRGKSLGGSSNTNYMVWMRGSPEDYNRWAEISGNPTWRYENVAEIYKNNIEDYDGHWKNNGYHSPGGAIHIEKAGIAPTIEYWLQAGQEKGYQVIDPNSYQTQGFAPMDVSQRRGIRFSTYRGYIRPNRFRPSLTVKRYAYATKIHFDENKKAIGVSYLRHDQPEYVACNKEVIVSGGAINSPQLLMLSGIGPKEHLESVGIDPLVDLPVGLNLQDHVTTIVGPFLLNKPVSLLQTRDATYQSVLDFLLKGIGPFSSATGITGTAMLSTKTAPAHWPNILCMLSGIGVHDTLGNEFEKFFGLKANTLSKYYGYNANNDSNIVGITLGLPRSRGYVRLKDSNPLSKPLIDPNYFSDPGNQDAEDMIDAIEKIVDLYETTETYAQLGARLAPNPFPGCENHVFRSHEYWECYIRTFTQTVFHPSGTCAMGKIRDPGTVVDGELRVVGVQGLRVADTSIMPYITNANTNAPAILIGEMCSYFVTQYWQNASK